MNRGQRCDGKNDPSRIFGDGQLHIAGGGRDQLRAMPDAQRCPGLTPLVQAYPDRRSELGLDQLLEHPGQARADLVVMSTAETAGRSSGRSESVIATGVNLLCVNPGKNRPRHAGGPPKCWTSRGLERHLSLASHDFWSTAHSMSAGRR
jgi:hypothetical protein